MNLIMGLFVGLFVFSCQESNIKSDKDFGPNLSEIEYIYNFYKKGDIKEYVKHMASCDSMPDHYVKNIIALHKSKFEIRKETHGVIDSFKVNRIIKSPSNTHAKVLITHYYSNSIREEILLQMVYKNDRWRIK